MRNLADRNVELWKESVRRSCKEAMLVFAARSRLALLKELMSMSKGFRSVCQELSAAWSGSEGEVGQSGCTVLFRHVGKLKCQKPVFLMSGNLHCYLQGSVETKSIKTGRQYGAVEVPIQATSTRVRATWLVLQPSSSVLKQIA